MPELTNGKVVANDGKTKDMSCRDLMLALKKTGKIAQGSKQHHSELETTKE